MAEELVIHTEGVGELIRAFGKIDKGLRKELRVELLAVAGLVAVEAKKIAQEKGLVDTGRLLRSIRPGLRGSVAYVQDAARNKGYNYPARLEYEKGGKRAFLHPALEAKRAEAVAGFEVVLDRLASEAGFARGGVL